MKKRLLSIAVALVLAVSLVPVSIAHADDDIRVTIDGQELIFADQRPVIVGGRTLVPVRGVFESLGFEVDWDDNTRSAILVRHDFTMIIPIGSATFTVNGRAYNLDVPAQIIGGRTMLPIRLPLESAGYEVDWDAAARTVIILTAPIWQSAVPGTQSAILLPDRRLTDEERAAWIAEYEALGGPSEFELEVVRIINEIRAEHGLDQLAICLRLMMSTRFYTQTLATFGLWGHGEGPYGGSGATAAAFGTNWNTANLTSAGSSPQSAVNSWMGSDGHRRNILNPDSGRIGIGTNGGLVYMQTSWGEPIQPMGQSSGMTEVHSGEAGDNITWTLDTGTGVLTLSGTGAMWDWAWIWYSGAPWQAHMRSITGVVISNGITHIGEGAFVQAHNLASVDIPFSITHIRDGAFAGATSLSSMYMPGVTHIGEGAFVGTTSLTSVYMPSVTYIGIAAFAHATSLTSATIRSRDAGFGDDIFYDTHPDFTMHAFTGSTAHNYAINNGHRFVPLD